MCMPRVNPLDKDTSLYRTKRTIPMVSSLEGFYCIHKLNIIIVSIYKYLYPVARWLLRLGTVGPPHKTSYCNCPPKTYYPMIYTRTAITTTWSILMKLLGHIYYVSNDYNKDDVHTTISAWCELWLLSTVLNLYIFAFVTYGYVLYS